MDRAWDTYALALAPVLHFTVTPSPTLSFGSGTMYIPPPCLSSLGLGKSFVPSLLENVPVHLSLKFRGSETLNMGRPSYLLPLCLSSLGTYIVIASLMTVWPQTISLGIGCVLT